MKDKTRTQAERTAATRGALIAAARPMFATSGFAGVSTEAIVASAGVTRGALYHQFSDKTDLFAAVLEAVQLEVTGQIDAVVGRSTETDPIALMHLGAGAWLDAFVEPAVHRIVLVEGPSVLGWERWREIGLRHGMGLVQGLLQYAMSVGRVAEQPVDPLAHVVIGALDEAVLFMASATDQRQARQDVGAVIDRLIDGFAVDPPPAQRRR